MLNGVNNVVVCKYLEKKAVVRDDIWVFVQTSTCCIQFSRRLTAAQQLVIAGFDTYSFTAVVERPYPLAITINYLTSLIPL